MSAGSPLADVWQPDGPEQSKTPTFPQHLAEQDLLKGRPLEQNPAPLRLEDLKPRNQDRVRILKRLSASPSGLHIKAIVSEVLKGQHVGRAERIDGSDPDYQFAYSFLNRLTEFVPPDSDGQLLEKRDASGVDLYVPTTALIDSISEGIAQTPQKTGSLTDRKFAADVLSQSRSLSDLQKEHLERSLESYINRIEDYRLLFDVVVYGDDGHGPSEKTMTKRYKTRFNDRGRVAKLFAQFNDSLEYHLENAENAVLCTLTTDPGSRTAPNRPNPRSIAETTSSINPNFNRLKSWLERESETIADTRREGVPQWRPELDSSNYHYFPDGVPKGGPPEGPVSGRPMESLDYIKVLEFSENGYPHLHVLFFDVPTRDSDGMPWLVDKNELSNKWADYGQGMIVDTYPLVKRDLDDLDADFVGDSETGFVDWYEFGDHGCDDEWIRQQQRDHDRIDFANTENGTENPMQKTAGAYLGKYLSAVLGGLMDANEEIDLPDDGRFEEKAATWKLALYWATSSRFFTTDAATQQLIQPAENLRECSDAADSARWATVDSVQRLAYSEIIDLKARQSWGDLDDLADAANQAAEAVVTPNVESTLPESSDFGVSIKYRGAYALWDMPTHDLSAPVLDDSTDQFGQAQEAPPPSRGDRPPPIADVWQTSD